MQDGGGADLVPDGKTVLTHCNAGALATAGFGTALGVIRAAVEAGKNIDVFADETPGMSSLRKRFLFMYFYKKKY